MRIFPGFSEGKTRFTPLPAAFYVELLPDIDHLGELKVTLYAFWRLDRMEGTFRFIQLSDFLGDARFMEGMGRDPADAAANLDEALKRAVERGTLLKAIHEKDGKTQDIYFLNSPKGRAAVEAIRQGKWAPEDGLQVPAGLSLERPNIFKLYEEHIGPLTPMIAETLRDAERTYPYEWIEDALRIAVENNVRRWRYVEAILRSWKEEGRNEQDRRDPEKDRRRYVEGEFSEFVEH
jgi:DnaD/phage-associated family protein